MTTNGTNAQAMHSMPAARAARLASGAGTSAAAEWHVIPCSSYVAPVFTDTKLHARRLSEASP